VLEVLVRCGRRLPEERDAVEATQAQTVQDCVSGEGRSAGQDRLTSADARRTIHQDEEEDEVTQT